MPQVSRTRKVQESLQTTTREGEVTIHLNLNITIDSSGSVQVEANGAPGVTTEESARKKIEIIPTELFSNGDDLLENFGEAKKT